MKLSWDQAHAWRLRRQFLDPREDLDAVAIVGRLCGVQAQVASSAEFAVRIRQAGPEAGGVQRGLADGALVKTWAMRGTLHLLRPFEAASFLSLIASARTWEKGAWQRAFGASPKQVDALAEAVAALLEDRVLTRDELVSELVANSQFADMEQHLRSGWAAVLKPLAWQGVLCQGPSRGGNVTFARPDALIPGWQGVPDPEQAAPTAIAAYLGAYGPATPDAFDAWLSRNAVKKATLRGWFAAMGHQLTRVDVDGQDAYILSEHADDLARAQPSTSVRLLGAFDQYVLGPGTKDPHLLPPAHRAAVSKAAGWISPVMLVGGRIRGVWELTDSHVKVSLFPGAAAPPAEDLEAEVAHVRRASGRDQLTLQLS